MCKVKERGYYLDGQGRRVCSIVGCLEPVQLRTNWTDFPDGLVRERWHHLCGKHYGRFLIRSRGSQVVKVGYQWVLNCDVCDRIMDPEERYHLVTWMPSTVGSASKAIKSRATFATLAPKERMFCLRCCPEREVSNRSGIVRGRNGGESSLIHTGAAR